MFGTITEATQESSQNTGFEAFRQNTGMSNSEWQPFENLGGENLLIGNNNFNNPSPPPLPVNLFENIGEGNLSPNNNNNLSPEGLDLNVATLVNALTGMNLTRVHYPREGNFIKPTKFEKTEMEDTNE